MDLYEVSSSGIKVIDVKKETRCGWRRQNNGFIKRSELQRYSRYTSNRYFYTTSKVEAVDWARVLHGQMINDISSLELSIRNTN